MDDAYSNSDRAAPSDELTSDEVTKTSESLHLSRKLFHTTGGLILAWFRVTMPQERFLFIFGSLLTLTFITELLRLNNFRPLPSLPPSLLPPVRKSESTRFSSTFYYQLGVSVVSAAFSMPIAILGILTLALGPPLASFSGRVASDTLPEGPARKLLSAKLVGNKSLVGTFAFVLATFLANMAALRRLGEGGLLEAILIDVSGFTAAVALAAAVAGALAELWTNNKWVLNWKRLPLSMDDNLLIPVAASCAASFVTGIALQF